MNVSKTVYDLVSVYGWQKNKGTFKLNADEIQTLSDIKYLFKNGHTSFKVVCDGAVTNIKQ